MGQASYVANGNGLCHRVSADTSPRAHLTASRGIVESSNLISRVVKLDIQATLRGRRLAGIRCISLQTPCRLHVTSLSAQHYQLRNRLQELQLAPSTPNLRRIIQVPVPNGHEVMLPLSIMSFTWNINLLHTGARLD